MYFLFKRMGISLALSILYIYNALGFELGILDTSDEKYKFISSRNEILSDFSMLNLRGYNSESSLLSNNFYDAGNVLYYNQNNINTTSSKKETNNKIKNNDKNKKYKRYSKTSSSEILEISYNDGCNSEKSLTNCKSNENDTLKSD
eukprot:jgi/Orpsp1_1/1180446/evm.model.c7180000073465.1